MGISSKKPIKLVISKYDIADLICVYLQISNVREVIKRIHYFHETCMNVNVTFHNHDRGKLLLKRLKPELSGTLAQKIHFCPGVN